MESFAIVPAASRGLWILVGGVLVLLTGVAILLIATARGSRSSRFEITDAGLRLHGDLYGRHIAAKSLRGGSARVVDLKEVRDLQPRKRSMGTAFPGYQAGWFVLRNGEEALLYLTDRRHAVYIPTTLGYSLLLSPEQPERFVERLRAIASQE